MRELTVNTHLRRSGWIAVKSIAGWRLILRVGAAPWAPHRLQFHSYTRKWQHRRSVSNKTLTACVGHAGIYLSGVAAHQLTARRAWRYLWYTCLCGLCAAR